MLEDIKRVKNSFEKDISSVKNLAELEILRVKYLGKKSEILSILGKMRDFNPEEKRVIGKEGNIVRQEIHSKLDDLLSSFKGESRQTNLSEILDITEPAKKRRIGSRHLVTQVVDDVIEIFGQFGFEYVDGPEIETDWYCFEQLNMPDDHPARDMQDTFYIDNNQHVLPRTHTSAMQIRYAKENKPPFRIVVPGRVYRNEDIDARHTFMFHQFEGMIVDKVTTVADCKSILTQIVRRLLGHDSLKLRFRHAFFPYTEPSFEIDGTCIFCNGKGCKSCSNKGWLELGGLGMVHPQVLRNCNIDPDEYQGFALGFGPERFVMLKNGVNYMPDLFDNDLRFNRQF